MHPPRARQGLDLVGVGGVAGWLGGSFASHGSPGLGATPLPVMAGGVWALLLFLCFRYKLRSVAGLVAGGRSHRDPGLHRLTQLATVTTGPASLMSPGPT